MQCHNGKSVTGISIWNTWETHVKPMWKNSWICPFHMCYWNFTCENSHVEFHMWKVTRGISHVKFHMWKVTWLHMWNFTWETSHGKFADTCTILYVEFHMWNFTCENSHVKINTRNFTCEISRVKNSHMGNFTCEISLVNFQMWNTCETHFDSIFVLRVKIISCETHGIWDSHVFLELHMCEPYVSHMRNFCNGGL